MSEDLNETRRERLGALLQKGVDPYPSGYAVTHNSRALHDGFDQLQGQPVAVAGRAMTIRRMGKAAFVTLRDGEGDIQVYLKLDNVGQENFDLLDLLDLGDWLGATGPLEKTKKGETTVFASNFTVLCKAIQTPPEKFHGLRDVELRYRRRYVDLFSNPQVRAAFVARSRIIQLIRERLSAQGFMEVETPMMQTLPGGANARPFITHHNALDRTLYLRIAPELYLKRLLVGGFERVFEINRNFRNEGVDTSHNPEFTMLELYQAHVGLDRMVEITEEIFATLCGALPPPPAEDGTPQSQWTFNNHSLNLHPPFAKIGYMQSMKDRGLPFDPMDLLREDFDAAAALSAAGLEDAAHAPTRGKMVEKTFEALVEPHLIQPTFVMDFPALISPLAKRKTDDPRLTHRFELIVAGMEVANAFGELNDPIDQRQRFEEQARQRQKDDEIPPIDEDFLLALEYGMPPAGGLGGGVDRLVMLFTQNNSIRDVILFPHMRDTEK